MSAVWDNLAARLEAELGPGAVEADPCLLKGCAVDGMAPSLGCAPANPEQLSAVLRLAAEAGAAVIPWGGGTAMTLGNPARRFDVVLSMEKFTRLVEHDDANLSATVEAGITIASLQARLAERRQFLPLDPSFAERATVGGTVAANLSGFRRALYGGARDRVIGMKVNLALGERVKAGGKVMKNVAGYDMCKLFVGSLGTLGIITELTFKLAPLPEKEATIVAWGALGPACALAARLIDSKLDAAAIAIVRAGALPEGTLSPSPSDFLVVFRAEGFEEPAARSLREARVMARVAGLDCEILDDAAHARLWGEIRDFGGNRGDILYRVTVPLAAVASVLETVESWRGPECGARIVADAAGGTVHLALEATPCGASWFPKLVALARERGGHAVMMAAPVTFKEGIDVWGEPPPGGEIMREIKRRLDPRNILSPGRFSAGI